MFTLALVIFVYGCCFYFRSKNTCVLSTFELSHLHCIPFPKLEYRENWKYSLHCRNVSMCSIYIWIDHLSSLDVLQQLPFQAKSINEQMLKINPSHLFCRFTQWLNNYALEKRKKYEETDEQEAAVRFLRKTSRRSRSCRFDCLHCFSFDFFSCIEWF